MHRMLRCIVGAWVLSAIAFVAFAQSGAAVAGSVLDANRDAVVGAVVRATQLESGRVLTAKTGAAGEYKIAGLSPGTYRLSVDRDGFASVARTVTLAADATVTQDFALAPATISDAITVTAAKGNARAALDTPQTLTVTTAHDIERERPWSTFDALERTPNLNSIAASPVLERPRLRGLDANRLLLLIDGERLNNFRSDPISGISPGVVDVTQLDSAEVVSGGGSSLYGSDAMAGTINLVTRTPARTDDAAIFAIRFDGDLHSNGIFRRGATAINVGTKRLAIRLSGSRFATGDYSAGDSAVDLQEVVRLGRLANDMGNVAGNNVARTYAVWQLPAQADIANGHAHGFNDQLDVWVFPSANHSIRYRQLNSQHKDIQFPFIAPPFDARDQFNGFRRFDKYGLAYEGRDLARWLPRLSASFYGQKFAFADDNFVSAIDQGSSWQTVVDPSVPTGPLPILTGRASTYTLANFTDGKNAVTSYGFNVQATMLPFRGAVVTTGVAALRDMSADDFSRVDFQPGTTTPRKIINGRASNPDSIYKNIGWFNLLEYEPARWLRLIGGLRVDNWQTEAHVTQGFPLDTEAAILDASLNSLIARPGQIDVNGLSGIADLVKGKSGVSTSRTVTTGNFGAVVRAPGRINVYARWANSYREPGITERYILRDFGDPTFSVLLVANTALKPERGNSYEFGVKTQRQRWRGSLAYFRNDLKDFLRPAFSNALFVPADPARGLEPISPFFPLHGIVYVQRVNTARARIQGVEGEYEANVSMGKAGSLSPYGTLGWLRGADLTPDATTVALINQFYNRADTAIPLRGSADDAPLSGITPFRGLFGLRYNSPKEKWLVQYQLRYQSRVERAAPLDLSTTIQTQYGTLAGLSALTVQSLRAGYTLRGESHRVSFVFGVDNLTDRFYFEQFQNAPAPGRSFVFGITTDFVGRFKR